MRRFSVSQGLRAEGFSVPASWGPLGRSSYLLMGPWQGLGQECHGPENIQDLLRGRQFRTHLDPPEVSLGSGPLPKSLSHSSPVLGSWGLSPIMASCPIACHLRNLC